MIMEIIYKNVLDESIEKPQAIALGEYKKIFMEGGSIKKVESYDVSVLEIISYYIEAGENETELVDNLSLLVTQFVVIYDPKVPVGSFYTQSSRQYRNGSLVLKGNILFDEFNNLICAEKLNLNTNLPIQEDTVKFYYGTAPTPGDDRVFEASYNADGSLFRIDMPDPEEPQDSEVYDTSTFGELEVRFPGPPDLSYYLTATLEP